MGRARPTPPPSPAISPIRVLIADDEALVRRGFTMLLGAGASGFLLKNIPPEQLAEAIRLVNRGNALLAPEMTRSLIEAFARTLNPAVLPPEQLRAMLPPRELEVLTLVARGLSNAETAERLVISEATAKTHVGHILTKLDRATAPKRSCSPTSPGSWSHSRAGSANRPPRPPPSLTAKPATADPLNVEHEPSRPPSHTGPSGL
jgi:predicted DNA-binding protein (UPF0251 family)